MLLEYYQIRNVIVIVIVFVIVVRVIFSRVCGIFYRSSLRSYEDGSRLEREDGTISVNRLFDRSKNINILEELRVLLFVCVSPSSSDCS